jgi:ATP-dependent DNA helicase RecQ
MDRRLPPAATAESLLQEVYGYAAFRGQQRAIIDTVAGGRDAFVLMPTGGGKSLCYQIPALLRRGVGVVVSPLIALMADQVAALRQLGIAAAYLNSTLSPEEQAATETALLNGELSLVYIAPERLMQPRTLALLQRCALALIAIDEAHCVSQWGHDFRPEYLRLAELTAAFPTVPRIALTATAEPRTRGEILERLSLTDAACFVHSFDRPNIRYRVAERGNAKSQLLQLLRGSHAGESGIVYCLSRRKTEDTAAWLRAQGIDAMAYHAGLDGEIRAVNQRRFQRGEGVVMVATVAFGMGIDKPDVRFVAHLDLPATLEAYYQETGRAGRDGEPAEAWMLYGLNDVVQRRRMIEESTAPEERKRVERHKLDAMLAYCELTSCRRVHLLNYFGEPRTEPCGNCDVCLHPPETWDATEPARKALSAVYRTGQRFGAQYLIDHLRGRADERARQFGHDRLSTFGLGADMSEKQWRTLLRQLIAHGHLAVDLEGYGGLRLGEGCRPLLRGEEPLFLRRMRSGPDKAARQRSSRVAETLSGDDQALWDNLRALRTRLAESQGVPPYVIFHDRALLAMAEHKPEDEDTLLTIDGVGAKKLAAYGEAFLAVIAGMAPEDAAALAAP